MAHIKAYQELYKTRTEVAAATIKSTIGNLKDFTAMHEFAHPAHIRPSAAVRASVLANLQAIN